MELSNPTYETFDVGDEKCAEDESRYIYAVAAIRSTRNVYDTVAPESIASSQDFDDRRALNPSTKGGE